MTLFFYSGDVVVERKWGPKQIAVDPRKQNQGGEKWLRGSGIDADSGGGGSTVLGNTLPRSIWGVLQK